MSEKTKRIILYSLIGTLIIVAVVLTGLYIQKNHQEEVIRERMARWTPLVKERTPSLAKYAALVTSADRGAILEIPGA